jgi:hypothetical protein
VGALDVEEPHLAFDEPDENATQNSLNVEDLGHDRLLPVLRFTRTSGRSARLATLDRRRGPLGSRRRPPAHEVH